jgi:division protein CdvB (Snf7/Vps24/ESCRT-III family)
MHAVNLTMRGASARLDAVESRLDELEPHFNDRVEKAAASAAARILREEIGRLLENE